MSGDGVSAGPAKRNTWQKDAVRHALGDATGFLSAQQLHQILRQHGSTIGLATVYRALADLAGSGEADAIQSTAGETLFRACGTSHHHHLICKSCGTTVEVDSSAVESWAATVAAAYGFTQPSHTIEIFGLCIECSRT